jgi:isopentenyl phosphate kinase
MVSNSPVTSVTKKPNQESSTSECDFLDDTIKVVVVKIGGSSITNKADKESANAEALDWFARIVSEAVGESFKAINEEDQDDGKSQVAKAQHQTAFIIVHGAGSFGHHSAKEYGLSGQTKEPNNSGMISKPENRFRKRGLSETRLSVQKLNHMVVSTLLDYGVNAVGLSPCFGVPGLEAHAHLQPEPLKALERVVLRTINAGLVPVLHGDACLYGDDAAILSGDTLVEVLGSLDWVAGAIFITDVDGVFDEDPRENPNAELLKTISVDPDTGKLRREVKASGSSHEHDVTGGLEVSC